MSLILGLDPGTKYTGCGIISYRNSVLKLKCHRVIAISPELSLPNKLVYLHDQLQSLIDEFKCSTVVIEKIFMGKNVDTAFKLGHIRGICLMLAAKNFCSSYEYASRRVRKMIAGSGAASKEQMAVVVKKLLNISGPIAIDASDALALAISHCQQIEIDKKIKKARES